MAFDTNRKRALLYGGDGGTGQFLGDTWEWDGQYWAQWQDIGPGPRYRHALAFDANRNRAVLFGGDTGPSLGGDTWEWDGQAWTQVADTGPSARARHALAYDSNRQRIVLFGGDTGNTDASGGLQSDTWEWDGADWTQVADTGPSARHWHCMTFDSTSNLTLVYGGDTVSGTRGDTWAWDGHTWEQVDDAGPGPLAGAALAFGSGVSTLHGGTGAVNAQPPAPLQGGTWQRQEHSWTHVQDMGPAPRWDHAVAFDSARTCFVLFGGRNTPPGAPPAAHLVGDTWEAPAVSTAASFAVNALSLNPSTVDTANTTTTATVAFNGPAPEGATLTFSLFDVPERREIITVRPVQPGSTNAVVVLPDNEVGRALNLINASVGGHTIGVRGPQGPEVTAAFFVN